MHAPNFEPSDLTYFWDVAIGASNGDSSRRADSAVLSDVKSPSKLPTTKSMMSFSFSPGTSLRSKIAFESKPRSVALNSALPFQ